jgi:hypothetical protein
MSFLPAAQNNPRRLLWALHELRVVAGRPAGVLLLHQACAARSRSRARGPLMAFADILIDMQVPSSLSALGKAVGGEGRSHPVTRRRHFSGVGRYPGTLEFVAAELNAEGTDYLLLPDDSPAAAWPPLLETLRRLLSQQVEALTRQEILTRWPEGEAPPRPDSLWRALTRGCELGLLVRSGEGNKAEAYRYGVAPSQPAA